MSVFPLQLSKLVSSTASTLQSEISSTSTVSIDGGDLGAGVADASSSATVIGLAVGLSCCVIVIITFLGFGYLLYRVPG